ncbi:hypothetical protein NMY22_g264 [Coprinellus aureogranulatus]|nr:hypothetical protein NMY22_g264 [Coprinellus aureogranulatus]
MITDMKEANKREQQKKVMTDVTEQGAMTMELNIRFQELSSEDVRKRSLPSVRYSFPFVQVVLYMSTRCLTPTTVTELALSEEEEEAPMALLMCVDVGRRRSLPDCLGADRLPLPLFVRSSYAVVPLPGRTPRIRLFWVRGCKTSSQDPDRHGPSDPTCTTTDNDPRGELPNATVRDGRLEVCISGLDIVGYAIQLGSNPYGGRNGRPESLQSSRNSMGSREVMGQKFRFSTQDALQLKSPSRLVPEPESVVSQGSMQRALCTGLPVALPGRPPQSSGRVMALIPAPPAKARPYLACFQVNLGEGALSTYLRHSGPCAGDPPDARHPNAQRTLTHSILRRFANTWPDSRSGIFQYDDPAGGLSPKHWARSTSFRTPVRPLESIKPKLVVGSPSSPGFLGAPLQTAFPYFVDAGNQLKTNQIAPVFLSSQAQYRTYSASSI